MDESSKYGHAGLPPLFAIQLHVLHGLFVFCLTNHLKFQQYRLVGHCIHPKTPLSVNFT